MAEFELVPQTSPISYLLDYHNPGHGWFITHLDKSPVKFKITAFLPVFTLNFIFASLLFWRGRNYNIAAAFFGEYITNGNAPAETAWYWSLSRWAIDVVLFKTLGPGVWKFITGHLWLRLRWGFRETEIIFRQPTTFSSHFIQDNVQFTNALYQAVDINFLRSNVGYNTRSGPWAVEYLATNAAYSLVATGEVSLQDFDLRVWKKTNGSWHVWQLWMVHNPAYQTAYVTVIKEKLVQQGKEELFDKWMDLLKKTHFNSDGTQRTATVDSDVATEELFRREGMDLAALMATAKGEVALRRAEFGL